MIAATALCEVRKPLPAPADNAGVLTDAQHLELLRLQQLIVERQLAEAKTAKAALMQASIEVACQIASVEARMPRESISQHWQVSWRLGIDGAWIRSGSFSSRPEAEAWMRGMLLSPQHVQIVRVPGELRP